MASPPGPPRRAETSPAGRCRWPGCGCTSWQTVTCSTCEPARSCAAELTPAFPTHPPRHEERAALAATRHFDLSDLRAYPGPSVHLPIEAVAFELAYRVDLPVDHLWSAVVRRFPELGGEERPRAFAELFARAVIVVQRLGMGLFATRWSVSAAGDGVATVAVQYVDPDVCRRCVELVADWLSDEDDGRPFDFEARYAEVLGRFVRSRFGGPTIYSILEAGYRAGLPTFYLESEDVIQWGYGRKQLRGRSTVLSRDSIKDTELTTYKDRAKDFLDDLGLPVPRGEIVFELDEARHAAARLGLPVVTKPVAGHKGQGVTTGISSERDLRMGFELAVQASESADDGVIVEQQISGTDHRLLTVGGRFVAALQRVPAYVVGDGEHTVEELIALENARPERAHGQDRDRRHPRAVRARQGWLPAGRAGPRRGAGPAARGQHLAGWRVGQRDRRHPPAQREAGRGRRQVPRRPRPRHRPARRRHHAAVVREPLRDHRDQRRARRVHAPRPGPGRADRRALHRAQSPLPDAGGGARAGAGLQPPRRRDGGSPDRAGLALPRRRGGGRGPPERPLLQRRVLQPAAGAHRQRAQHDAQPAAGHGPHRVRRATPARRGPVQLGRRRRRARPPDSHRARDAHAGPAAPRPRDRGRRGRRAAADDAARRRPVHGAAWGLACGRAGRHSRTPARRHRGLLQRAKRRRRALRVAALSRAPASGPGSRDTCRPAPSSHGRLLPRHVRPPCPREPGRTGLE